MKETREKDSLMMKNNKLVFPSNFRNKKWAENFGHIQKKFEEKKFETLIIDFSRLIWIDPLPLLSLQISLRSLDKTKTTIILPDYIKYPESKKVLGFLYSEGFFSQFPSQTEFYSLNEKVLNFNIFEQFISETYYTNSSIINAQVVDITNVITQHGNSIDEWIKNLLAQFEFRIKNKVEIYKANEIINRLRILLTETITNVFEHAYGSIENKYVGIYVRFRKGLTNTRISKSEIIALEDLFKDEHLNSPKLDSSFVKNVFNFIEVFIIDSGCGLSTNYGNTISNKKFPFREAWREAIINKKRGNQNNKKIQKRTSSGGLYFIYKNLGKNYICARDSNEWIGHSTPSLDDSKGYYESINSDVQVMGFSIIYRLTWDVASDHEKYWTKLNIDTSPENILLKNEHPLYLELKRPNDIYARDYELPVQRNQLFIIDNRFNFSTRLTPTIYNEDGEGINNCVFLPSRTLQKNAIHDIIEKNFGDVTNSSKSLIICDILAYQANLYEQAIENSKFSDNFLSNFDKIILVSERLSVLTLIKEENRYIKEEDIYRLQNTNNRFSPQHCLEDLIGWLRTHDSFLLWLLIKEKSEFNDSLYINDKISWSGNGNSYSIDGYLNFAQIESDSDISKIIENSLKRAFSLCNIISLNAIKFTNIDILTSRLASKMNLVFYNNSKSEKSKQTEILLGSVFVSGQSQNSNKQITQNDLQIPVHFFLHSFNEFISTDNEHLHLFLWPEKWLSKKFPNQNRSFERVGRSHVIAPYGWKYYTVPRYQIYDSVSKKVVKTFSEVTDKENNKFEFISAYGSTPNESYKDWQVRQQIIEFGHFDYGGKHDFVKVDFCLALEESFNDGGKLATFILSEFLIGLGLGSDDIIDPLASSFPYSNKLNKQDFAIIRKFEDLKNSVKKYIENANHKEEFAAIVYPSHFNTNSIIEKVKEYIPSKFHRKIFALVPIYKDHSGTSHLISPLVLEQIKQEILTSKKEFSLQNVLLFDEATINGNTRKELKHLLFHLGASNVKTLCLLDRRRLPFSTTIPEKHKAFWRLDIPRLGNKGDCSICKAVGKIESFEHRLIYTIHRYRLNQWKTAWKSVFPYSKNPEHGISTKPLNTEISKKFSIYIDENSGEIVHNDNIQLINSIGLTLYSAEIHSMTAKHDMALNLCEDDTIDNLVKIEILCANLLFYAKDFTDDIMYEMIIKLFEYCNNERNTSNETALGALTILAMPLAISTKILEPFISSNTISLNLDIQLVLSYFVQLNPDLYKKNILLANFQNAYSKNNRTVYYKLHHEIHNDRGRHHNKAFDEILILHENSIINIDKIEDALASSDRLKAIIKFFPYGHMRDFNKELFEKIDFYLTKLEKSLKRHLYYLQKINISKYYNQNLVVKKDLIDIQLEIARVLKLIKDFHGHIFIKVGMQEKDSIFPLKSKLLDIIEKYNSEFKTRAGISAVFKKKVEVEFERWVPWDREIERQIRYILSNARHSKGFITNIGEYRENDSSEIFNMLVSIEYEKKGLNLVFENFSYSSIEDIQLKTEIKIKPEEEHIQELGGTIIINGQKIKDNLFRITTRLYLPYP